MERLLKNQVEYAKIDNILVKTKDEEGMYTWEELMIKGFKFGNGQVANQEELQKIYKNKNILGDFKKEWYWVSSYSRIDGYPRLLHFGNGEGGTSYKKNDKARVRCVYGGI